MMARSIPLPGLRRSAAAVPTCHGCKHTWYSAPDGQVGDYPGRPAILSQPHSRCTALGEHIPMLLDGHRKWIGSVVPAACPIHAPAPVSMSKGVPT